MIAYSQKSLSWELKIERAGAEFGEATVAHEGPQAGQIEVKAKSG